MTSIQTTLARGEASAAAAAWKDHRLQCVPCSVAARQRAWACLCPRGSAAREAHIAASSCLDESRELDRQPRPGQEALW